MGMFWLVVKLFGSLPSTVLLGGFLDWACLVWQESCSGRGFCWIYSDDLVFKGYVSIPLATKIVCVILYGLGAVYFVPAAQKSNQTYEAEKEDQQENETTDF